MLGLLVLLPRRDMSQCSMELILNIVTNIALGFRQCRCTQDNRSMPVSRRLHILNVLFDQVNQAIDITWDNLQMSNFLSKNLSRSLTASFCRS